MHHLLNLTSNWTDSLTAIGTLLAVLAKTVSSSFDKFKNYFSRPVLKVGINMTPPECHKTTAMSNQKLYSAFWFRFFVSNEGKSNATNLEMIIEKVERLEDGEWKIYSAFLPSTLVWTHINKPNLKNLLPEIQRIVILVISWILLLVFQILMKVILSKPLVMFL